ncbi:Nodule-specific Glycine Rich Peptide [Medicago truncatula]|uniref:Nodule-specific Glycine Rich Peptide n=1 Tax=Medicago truncatula TaxID=3880 RepID=A0A072V8I8_MEDTR|nr:Nodule-specific Glycine Rich Peptide [Medicago truncatula]
MKIKHFFFMFFLCLLLFISTRAIQTSKDGNQIGVAKVSKTKVGIDGWRDWGGSFWEDGQENNGGSDKEGGEGKGEELIVGEIGEDHFGDMEKRIMVEVRKKEDKGNLGFQRSKLLLLYGVTRESKTKIGTDGWRDWGGSFWEDGQENNGGGKKNSGQGKGAKEIGEVHESVTEGWRDWGGSFWDDEKENIGGINKEGAHEKGAKGKDEDNISGRDNIDGYNGGGMN